MATNPFAQIQPDQQTAAPTSDATNPFSQIAQSPDASSTNSSPSGVSSAPPKSLAQHALDAFHTSLEDVGIPNTAEEISQANKMLGEQMRHPFRTAKQVGTATGRALLSTNDTDALQKSKEEYNKGNYVESARHFINYLVPLVGGSADKSGDAVDNKEWGKAIGHVVPAILPALFGGGEEHPITNANEAAANAARQFKETPKEVAPAGTVLGERTTLRPTTQTTAGVEAPISALQQENPSAIAKAAEKFTSPNAAKEFQRGTVIPAATRQLVSTVGQVAEDRINAHDAVMNEKPVPEKLAGTQVPSKYDTIDSMANAASTKAQETYRKADVASDNDIAAWQQKVKQALDEHKDLIDHHNANIDAYNAQLGKDETPMPRAVYDPNTVAIPEKPQSYSELKADLDRAKANSASPDAAVREEAYKTEIPKAEKAIDGWFKQHSDIISPAEYQSAKSLYADSQRYQDIANGLRSAMNKGTVTGNTLRGLEANIDNKMIRRGQAPGAFKRLLGDDGYQNWKTVTKLFDPIKGQPSLGEQAIQWLTAGATSFLPHTYGATLLGKAGSEWLLNRVLFNPEFGAWFGKTANYLKYLATSERGELGMPDSLRNEFDNIINNKTSYTGEERRAGARPTMSATELEDAIKNRRPINNPFDQTEGARATMNRDPNMPKIVETPRVHPAQIDPSVKDSARLNPFPPEEVKIKEFPAVKGESGEGAGRSAGKPTVRITGPNGSSIELELDEKTARVKGIVNSGVKGDGQRLYDNAIEWAKDSGYNTFSGDNVQTEAGKTAWRRIAERHNARMSEDGVPHIDISGSRPQ